MPKKTSPPPKLNHVQQPKLSSLCLAACVAMITGETLATVVAGSKLRIDPPDFEPWMEDKEASRYLALHGLSYGLYACPTKKMTGAEKFITVRIPLTLPAILTVDSRRVVGGSHAVVCSGRPAI